jgi:hypothetical protein
MRTNFKPVKTLAFASVSLAGLLAQSAHAQSELILISGSTVIPIAGSGGLASFSFNGSVGGWTLDVSTGLATPLQPVDTIDLNSISLSAPGTANPLEILWSSTGYTPGSYSASVGGTLSTGITDTFTSYYGGTVGDQNISVDAPLLTGPLAFSSNPFSGTDSGVASGASPVLTEMVVISGGNLPFSETSFDFNVAPVVVPEPADMGTLFGGACLSSLVGACFVSRKLKRAA